MKLCMKCRGWGFYLDPGCNSGKDGGTCAHGPRTVTVRQILTPAQAANRATPMVWTEKRARVMQCPKRACPCPRGNDMRKVLKAKARKQEAAFVARAAS